MMSQAAGRNLTGKSFLNVLSSTAGYSVSLVVNFFLNPILVGALGAGTFGIWRICQRLLVYVAAADGRPTQALKWTIANRQLQDDVPSRQRQVGCALAVWLRFLPFMLAFGALLTWFAPFLIRGLPLQQHSLVRITFAILVVNLILFPLRTIPEAVMVGMNLGYRTTWINAFGVIAGGIFMALAAYLHFGLIGLAFAVLFASLLNGMLIFFQARRSLPWLGVRKAVKDEFRKFFGFSLWIFAWSFINKLMLSSDVVILGMVSAPTRVAAYVLCYYTIQTAIHLIGLFVSGSMPGLGAIVGQKQLERASRVRLEILDMTLATATLFGAMILLWNRSFVGLWVGGEHFIGMNANLLLVVLMTQLALIRNEAQIIDVTLEVKTKVILGGVSTGISLGLAFVLGRYLLPDIIGVLIGLIAGRLILSLTYPVMVNKALGGETAAHYPGTIRNWAMTLVIYGLCYLAGRYWVATSWIELIPGALASLVVVAGLIFFLGLTTGQRRQLRHRLHQLPLPWVH